MLSLYSSDIFSLLQWWIMILLLGVITFPLVSRIFASFIDKGYIFSKIISFLVISYAIFLLATIRLIPFTRANLFILLGIVLIAIVFYLKKAGRSDILSLKKYIPIFLFEEFLFLIGLGFWAYIKAHQPEIHGLEKYMDFGFINSALRSEYFPAKDMWLTPLSINYYYFGHIVTAVLTKISDLPSSITYNLMLSTIFSLCFTSSFSIGINLIHTIQIENVRLKLLKLIAGGILCGFLVTLSGNFHTIYSFFKPYQNEKPVPIWQLELAPQTFSNSYWYPNATRFIHNTIHEFPIYSFVVSDLHGHVLSIPIVLTIIAVLLSIFLKHQNQNHKLQPFANLLLISFLLAVAYMTNAWDGLIYFLLTTVVIFIITSHSTKLTTPNKSIKYFVSSMQRGSILTTAYYILIVTVSALVFSLPFNLFFKPFVSGIGILCVPELLVKIGKIGPFLFEADHCQRSPIWQLVILYGFFYFWVVSFITFLLFKVKASGKNLKLKIKNLPSADLFVLILIFLSTLLIIIPEFIYAKDIYPAHYRANTMFKLTYEAFIMLSISCGYIIWRISFALKPSFIKLLMVIVGSLLVFLVLLYPHFAINSYFDQLKTYYGLDGTKYLKTLYSADYEALMWLNTNTAGQPVIVEAQGDSYTDYARVSANTGLPTILGWTVHEWLWRGSYDVPSPRIEEIKSFYETTDINTAKNFINKYNVDLVFIGQLEKEKYPSLNEEKLNTLGKIIFDNGETKIYKL